MSLWFRDYLRLKMQVTKRCPTCGKPDGNTRTSRENRYYWPVVVGILADEFGNTPKVMHEILKMEQGLRETCVHKGKRYEVAKSTTEYTTSEFEAYLSRCRIWASEQGVFIPLPNEKDEAETYLH